MVLAQAAAAAARDTVRIVDTLRLVRVDTVWVAQPAAGFVEIATAWSTVAVAVLALAAIAVEVWREIARSRESARETAERRAAVDARMNALVYALHRQLMSWVTEAPADVTATVAVVDAWAGAVKDLGGKEVGDVPVLTAGMMDSTVAWAMRRTGQHFDKAEERILTLLGLAPEASAPMADGIRRAYVLFYKATGRLSPLIAVPPEHEEMNAASVEVTAALHDLEACIRALDPLIGAELRAAATAL